MKRLRSFLGLVNYYRDFLPNMAEIAVPYTKRGTMEMERRMPRQLPSIAKALTNNPITLGYPNWKRHYYVKVDASGSAIGGVLAQKIISTRSTS